jgi:hypothetical protein
MYPIGNILARNNSRKLGRAAARFQPLPNFCSRFFLPEPRLIVSSLGRVRIVNFPKLTLICSALLAACAHQSESTTLPRFSGSLADLPIWGFGMFSRLTGIKSALGSLAFL